MKKKKIVIMGLVILAVGIIGYMLYLKQTKAAPVNIISLNQKIPLQDVKMFLKDLPIELDNEDPRKYFSKEIINSYTVKYFKFLQREIKYISREKHLKEVREYLHSVMDPDKADEIFALYEKFIDYEAAITEKAKSWAEPRTADELLRYLQSVQDYRREVWGVEVADAMWGAEVKADEYSIRKNSIKLDPDLYGTEKEKRINALKEDMWGADAALIEEPPKDDPEKYSKYQEKQALYQKDLEELSAAERMEKIKEFRRDYFSSDQIARLEQVDEELEMDRKRESDYYAREKVIMNDPGIAADKKAEVIRELQDNIFGEETDALRRRLNIQRNIK